MKIEVLHSIAGLKLDNICSELITHMLTHASIPCRRKGCKKVFYRLQDLKKHERNCRKKMKCITCEAAFASKSVLSAHMATHGDPMIFCELCGKGFYKKPELITHMLTHATTPCRREGCSKMFFQLQDRAEHELVCGKETKITCPKCDAIFNTGRALTFHMKKHKDPTFFCEVCNKGFYRRSSCQKHSRDAHSIANVECKVCGKCFNSYKALRVHKQSHTQE